MKISHTNKLSQAPKSGKLHKPAEKRGLAQTHKYYKTEDGRTVRLKRVRRKKQVGQAALAVSNPNTNVKTGDRVSTTSEMNKPAPVQGKTSAYQSKKPRRRAITPGISGIIKKANPAPKPKDPFSLVEMTL